MSLAFPTRNQAFGLRTDATHGATAPAFPWSNLQDYAISGETADSAARNRADDLKEDTSK